MICEFGKIFSRMERRDKAMVPFCCSSSMWTVNKATMQSFKERQGTSEGDEDGVEGEGEEEEGF
jgi:hypothetical protein